MQQPVCAVGRGSVHFWRFPSQMVLEEYQVNGCSRLLDRVAFYRLVWMRLDVPHLGAPLCS